MTFLFASNLPELLFLSRNFQGMRSLYQFPLTGACVLCKTAWAWYSTKGVRFLNKNMKNYWESTQAGL